MSEPARVYARANSSSWYVVVEENGETIRKSLGVRVEGKRPDKKRGFNGCPKYHRSRDAAIRVAERFTGNIREKLNEVRLLELAYKLKTGETPESLPLAGLADFWRTEVARKKIAVRHEQWMRKIFDYFVTFIKRAYPKIRSAEEIRKKHSKAFHNWMIAESYSTGTCEDMISLLTATFTALVDDEKVVSNPFKRIQLEPVVTVHKRSFTDPELKAILAVVQQDTEWRAFVALLLLTALRCGDASKLEWKAIDWERQIVRLQQSKTGVPVFIPIHAALLRELKELWDAQSPAERLGPVFPRIAATYMADAAAVSYQFIKVLKLAGFSDDPSSPKAIRVRPVRGRRAINIIGTHALRTTLSTRAIVAGVPPALVRKVTGHTNTGTLEKHYLQPEVEEVRTQFTDKLPNFLALAERPIATPKKHNQETNL